MAEYQVERSLHHEKSRRCKQQENLLRLRDRVVAPEIPIAGEYREPESNHGYSTGNESDNSNAPGNGGFVSHAFLRATCLEHCSRGQSPCNRVAWPLHELGRSQSRTR